MTLRRETLLLAATCALALAAWVAGWFLPWIDVAGSDVAVDRNALSSSKVAYERALVNWPVVALPAAAVALVALAVAEVRALRAKWTRPAWLAVAAAGFLATVSGMRVLGFAVVRALDSGDAVVRPGPASLATLVAGIAILALAARALVRARTVWPWSAVAAAATLLMLPLLPFGRSGSGTFNYDELTLAATAGAGGVLASAAKALAWARGALWVAVGGGIVILACESLPKPLPQPGPLLVLAPGPLAAVLLVALFQVRWAAIDGLGVSWNAAAPLGALASVALLAGPARAALTPWRNPQGLFKDDTQ